MNESLAKVLIIDDEEIVLDSCMRILKKGPYHAATAMDGTFGLELVHEFHPDIVFVDLKMPGISGFEVLEKITEFDPTIVTVVITGYATVDSAVEAIKKGAYDFLPKPFTPDEFRVITQRGLERRKLVLETTALRHEREMLREQFAAIVSHELKAPLGAIQQNIFAFEHELAESLSEDQLKRIQRMKGSIDNLLKLIHTWLRVISSDIMVIQEKFEALSIKDFLVRAVESVEPHAIRKDIDLEISIDDDLDPIQGDSVTLGEAIVNLVNNGIKYSHMGSKIYINASQAEDEIIISVKDRGVGISEEDLPHIFGDFYVGKSAPESGRGAGLGLALTRRILEAHGASIAVESALKKGSTFTIRLPIYRKEDQEEPVEDAEVIANKI